MNILNYSNIYKKLYISGDIHGEFRTLVYNLKRLAVTDAVIIVAGDCGVGFEKTGYYEILYRKISNTLEKLNCCLLLVRGNHDDPSCFENHLIDFPRMQSISDYSIVQVADRNILCIGGAISLDRHSRLLDIWERKINKKESKPIYWENEYPIYNEQIINQLHDDNINIDTVITHTAPAFCYPKTKRNYALRLANDTNLEYDVKKERATMDSIYNQLVSNNHKIKDWLYGHFHDSHTEMINETKFTLLNIDQLFQVE